VTGDKITSQKIQGQFFGRTIYFCCQGCLEDAKQNPTIYLKPTHQMQVAAVKALSEPSSHHHHHQAAPEAKSQPAAELPFLGRGDGIETCPVMGSPIDKSLKFEWKGQTYYACCESCIDTMKKSPERYLKPQQSEAKADAKPQTKPEAKPETKPEAKPEAKPEVKTEAKPEAKAEAKKEADQAPAQEPAKPAAEKKFLGKGDGIESCPVTGEPVEKEIKVEIGGRTVYACCPPCLDDIKKNPDLYLKKQ
jgi:YHS domain-containing protein